jgi:hypothetical protein
MHSVHPVHPVHSGVHHWMHTRVNRRRTGNGHAVLSLLESVHGHPVHRHPVHRHPVYVYVHSHPRAWTHPVHPIHTKGGGKVGLLLRPLHSIRCEMELEIGIAKREVHILHAHVYGRVDGNHPSHLRACAHPIHPDPNAVHDHIRLVLLEGLGLLCCCNHLLLLLSLLSHDLLLHLLLLLLLHACAARALGLTSAVLQ